jgi:tetratricopeptide (TPR) repeat protein
MGCYDVLRSVFILTVRMIQRPLSLLLSSGFVIASVILLPVSTTAQANGQAAEVMIGQGLQLIQQGRLNEAIDAFQRATRLNPNLAAAHYNLGLALRQQGQLQASATAFHQATQADPNFALAYANLGAALIEGNNLAQARDYLQRSLELNPQLGLARCLSRSG